MWPFKLESVIRKCYVIQHKPPELLPMGMFHWNLLEMVSMGSLDWPNCQPFSLLRATFLMDFWQLNDERYSLSTPQRIDIPLTDNSVPQYHHQCVIEQSINFATISMFVSIFSDHLKLMPALKTDDDLSRQFAAYARIFTLTSLLTAAKSKKIPFNRNNLCNGILSLFLHLSIVVFSTNGNEQIWVLATQQY